MNTLQTHEKWRRATALIALLAGSLTLSIALDSKNEASPTTPSSPKVTAYDEALAFLKSAKPPEQLFVLSDRPGFRGLDANISCDSDVDRQGFYRQHPASYTDKQHPVLFPLVVDQEPNYIRADEMAKNILPDPEFIGVDVAIIRTNGHEVTVNSNLSEEVETTNHSQPRLPNYNLDNGAVVEGYIGALHYVLGERAGQAVVAAACNDILTARNAYIAGVALAKFNHRPSPETRPLAPNDSILSIAVKP